MIGAEQAEALGVEGGLSGPPGDRRTRRPEAFATFIWRGKSAD